jgi:hypothetical protein
MFSASTSHKNIFLSAKQQPWGYRFFKNPMNASTGLKTDFLYFFKDEDWK